MFIKDPVPKEHVHKRTGPKWTKRGDKKGSNTNGNKTIQSRIKKTTRPNDKLNIHKQRNILKRTNLKCK